MTGVRNRLGAALAVLLLAGCGWFDTREPIEGEGDSSDWEIPTTPEIIVRNLIVAFENGNFNDYRRALSSDFRFVPDGTDVAELAITRPGQPVYENWTAEVETETAETIRQDSLSVELSNLVEEIEGQDRRLRYDYVLTRFQDPEDQVFSGELFFRVREVSGEWIIFEWEDVASSSDPSWGRLKGELRVL